MPLRREGWRSGLRESLPEQREAIQMPEAPKESTKPVELKAEVGSLEDPVQA